MSRIETNKKVVLFCKLKHCGKNYNYQTKSKTTRLLNIQIYGTQSTKYNCIKDWNNFRNNFPNTSLHHCTYTLVKKLVKGQLKTGNLAATISDHLPQFAIILDRFGIILDNK